MYEYCDSFNTLIYVERCSSDVEYWNALGGGGYLRTQQIWETSLPSDIIIQAQTFCSSVIQTRSLSMICNSNYCI
jgi:hypothetical protein